jgi:hypothetical protein
MKFSGNTKFEDYCLGVTKLSEFEEIQEEPYPDHFREMRTFEMAILSSR